MTVSSLKVYDAKLYNEDENGFKIHDYYVKGQKIDNAISITSLIKEFPQFKNFFGKSDSKPPEWILEKGNSAHKKIENKKNIRAENWIENFVRRYEYEKREKSYCALINDEIWLCGTSDYINFDKENITIADWKFSKKDYSEYLEYQLNLNSLFFRKLGFKYKKMTFIGIGFDFKTEEPTKLYRDIKVWSDKQLKEKLEEVL